MFFLLAQDLKAIWITSPGIEFELKSRMHIFIYLRFPTLFLFLIATCFAEAQVTTAAIESAFSQNSACLDRSLVNSVLSTVKVTPQPTDEMLCDPTNMVYKTIKALIYLNYGQFEAMYPSGDDLFYNDLGDAQAQVRYFTKQVKNIIVKSCPENDAIAYVNIWAKNQIMYVCQRVGIHPLFLASSLLHEARHLEGVDHVNCKDGNVCDQSMQERGGFYYTIQYLVQVAKFGKNFSQELKTMARSLLAGYVFRFDSKPKIKSIEVIALRSNENKIVYLNADLKKKKTNFQLPGRLFKITSNSLVLILDEIRKEFVPMSLYGPSLPDYDAYREAPMINRSYQGTLSLSVKDITLTSSKNYFGLLTGDGLVLKSPDSQLLKLPFENPKQIIQAESCGIKVGDTPIQVIQTESNQYFLVQFLEGRTQTLQAKEIQGCQLGIINMTTIGNNRVALFEDGTLRNLINDKWILIPGFENQHFNFMSDSFVVYPFLLNPDVDAIPADGVFNN